jgi:hypothetical protein
VAKAITRAQVKQAVQRAAQHWIDKHGGQPGGQSAGARAADARGTPISQQNLGWASKGQKIGEKMAWAVAALYDTTPDGLVGEFVGGIEETALKNVPGWARAKAAARDELGTKVDPWVWSAIDDVTVPTRLRPATVEMVRQIAQFLDHWGGVSGVRARVQATP